MSKVNYEAPINSLGYGVVGYNVWKNLRQTRDITLWPMANKIELPVAPDSEVVENLKQDWADQENFDHKAPCFKIWHEYDLAKRIGSGKYVAYPFFEVNKFEKRRRNSLASVDELVVSSDWAKQIVLENTSIPASHIHIVPCGVDRHIFSPTLNKPQETCTFLNCGKWEIRKGHDILGDAFKDAFCRDERVELWMMTENPFLTAEERQVWEGKYSNDPRIKMISRKPTQEDVAQVMSQAFCGVFPSRAEGWNLELLEMMSMGKTVIATNYSAHTAFCTPDNSILIDIKEEEPAYDGKWFVGDSGTWASLYGDPYDQLVRHMRDVYDLWVIDRNRVNTDGLKTAAELSWVYTSKLINDILGE